MATLFEHMYEYTKVIALKENDVGMIDESYFSKIKSLYIGYLLLVLILKYYVHLFKEYETLDVVKNNKINKNQAKLFETHINFNIINEFNTHFPGFENYIVKVMHLLIDITGN